MTKQELAAELTQLEEELNISLKREEALLNDLDYYMEEYEYSYRVNVWTGIICLIVGLVIGLII